MPAKMSDLSRHIGIDVEHSRVVVTQYPQAIGAHHAGHAGSGDPLGDRRFRGGLPQVPGDQVVIDTRPLEDAGDFRDAARLAVSKPLSRHRTPIAEGVEALVVDRRHRLNVQHDNRNPGSLRHGEHGG